ncbi:hypothetical protein [Roseovarius sp.]|uniref:hypothetical protein n=1 Tax=Roseovarius sp. TaxID=1486281 RepID=UPI0035666AA3
MKSFLIATTAAALIATTALAEFTPVKPITETFDVEGQTTTITVDPQIRLSGQDGLVEVGIKAIIDAGDLQGDLVNLMNRNWKKDECGERFRTHSATIRPAGDKLSVGVTAQAQLWECVKTKVPKTYFENKCVLHAFGKCQVKTKVPVIRWEMETAKTKLISQSARLEALVTPVFDDGQITAQVQVTNAMPSGLAGDLVRLFGLQGKVRDLVQKEVSAKVAGQGFAFPPEVMAYDPQVEEVDFVDLGGGKLGIALEATGRITQAQVAALLAEQMN